jgi:hypothetical protein
VLIALAQRIAFLASAEAGCGMIGLVILDPLLRSNPEAAGGWDTG